mmetsp:Transcript_717/g.2411  ORF Transcript_717/g.2411 Transcript_717/m.2411 type:complete len:202 (+) Transcript_717:496-1101(+)
MDAASHQYAGQALYPRVDRHVQDRTQHWLALQRAPADLRGLHHWHWALLLAHPFGTLRAVHYAGDRDPDAGCLRLRSPLRRHYKHLRVYEAGVLGHQGQRLAFRGSLPPPAADVEARGSGGGAAANVAHRCAEARRGGQRAQKCQRAHADGDRDTGRTCLRAQGGRPVARQWRGGHAGNYGDHPAEQYLPGRAVTGLGTQQ